MPYEPPPTRKPLTGITKVQVLISNGYTARRNAAPPTFFLAAAGTCMMMLAGSGVEPTCGEKDLYDHEL